MLHPRNGGVESPDRFAIAGKVRHWVLLARREAEGVLGVRRAPSNAARGSQGRGLRALANRSGLYGPEPPERADRSRHPGIFEAVRADGIDVHLDERGQPRIVERDFVVEPELDGLRLDQFLKHKIPRLSRTRIQAIIRESVSFADGRPARPNRRVAAGDRLVLRREAQPEPPCPRRFDVLHRDDEVMVIDKPAGLPVHISARYYFNTLTRVVSERFPGEGWQICHRLDRETSGVMVLARGRAAAAALKGAFERKQTRKRYLAVVHGRPAERFAIDLPLGLTADPNALISIRMVVRDDAAPARTEVRTISTTGSLSLLECRPITGRQHQIRAHLAAVGHPIVGDKLYGHGDEVFAAACDDRLDPETRAALILPRHALHAASIEIPHPSSGEMLSVESPLPADMAALVNR